MVTQTPAAMREAYMAGGIGMRGVAERFGVGTETVRHCLFDG
jgi:hypothetical protein